MLLLGHTQAFLGMYGAVNGAGLRAFQLDREGAFLSQGMTLTASERGIWHLILVILGQSQRSNQSILSASEPGDLGSQLWGITSNPED